MIEIAVVGEGPAEETFFRDVLGPALAYRQIFIQPRLIPKSRHGRGGALSRDRVLRYLRNALRERSNLYVATFFDLYALDTDFPGWSEAEAGVGLAQCRADRFLPHIQPHEFEALLFSDTDRLVEIDPDWKSAAAGLRLIRASVTSPEHIDEGPQTHPSARLDALLRPRFRKVLHGPRAAAQIGIGRIRAECRHFGDWLARVEGLGPCRSDPEQSPRQPAEVALIIIPPGKDPGSAGVPPARAPRKMVGVMTEPPICCHESHGLQG